MISIKNHHPVLKIAAGALYDLPSPANISSMWNFGSLLGLCLITQIATGLFLATHYTRDIRVAFTRVNHIYRDVNMGWLLRACHANGASFFFICLYLHVGRGLYYGSYYFMFTWSVGVVILLLVMAAAFLGYVLPWGQMSFWGATVITNLFSAIPVIGGSIVNWLWGGFAVDNATLTRFFAFHFVIPFIIAGASMVHLLFLHQTGSNNPLGIRSNLDKISFHPYFTFKDLRGFFIILLRLLIICLLSPWALGDPENFIPANPLVTPVHIQPEWYFLFAYAILRSIPNKLGGVIALAIAVIVLIFLPHLTKPNFRGLTFYPCNKFLFWSQINTVILLTWIGARPVEEPYVIFGQVLTVIYFRYYLIFPYLQKLWDRLIAY